MVKVCFTWISANKQPVSQTKSDFKRWKEK
jgi:hypothetical protein